MFEAANHGRFEKIYPLPVKEAKESSEKAQLDLVLSNNEKQQVH